MRLTIEVWRLTYQTSRRYTFPYPAANRLRGAIGYNLRHWDPAIYDQAFAPAKLDGPSGLADAPRPMVLRSAHLDGRTFDAGEPFWFDLHLLELRLPWKVILAECFGHLLTHAVTEVSSRRLELPLDPITEQVGRLRVRFESPTELKSGGGLAARPEFGILASRARDRIATLSALYGEGPLQMDFSGFGERAKQVEMVACSVQQVQAERVSRATGQRHSLGGFVGEAEYAGEIAEFLPILRAAQWTGVGRQTSWGKGHISLLE